MRELRPDVVFAIYLKSAGMVASMVGHPRLVLSAIGSDVNVKTDSKFWRWMLRWACGRSALVHAVSEDLAMTLVACYGVDPERLVVAPVGLRIEGLSWTSPEARPGTGQIISTRAHRKLYDQPTLVRALARLKSRGVPFHATFTHLAEVESTKQIVQMLDLEAETTFRPGFAQHELSSLLGSHDVYVSSSVSDGTSQSLLEAMVTGTFPVVSDIPANRPWIENGRNGLLFPVGDDGALAECLKEAFRNREIQTRAAKENRSRVLEFACARTLGKRLLEAFVALP